jgi:phosphoribosylformylglycinamidine synthase
LLHSAHDCSDGGLAVALAECCLEGKIGAELNFHRLRWMGEGRGAGLSSRPDIAFFGETPTLVVVSVAPEDGRALEKLCEESGVPCHHLGRVGGDDLVMSAEQPGGRPVGLRVPVARIEKVYETALPRAMGE